MSKIIYLTTITLASISLSGAIVYRVFRLDTTGVVISLVLAIILFLFLIKKLKQEKNISYRIKIPKILKKNRKKSKSLILLFTIYYLLLTASFAVLALGQTTQSIISPWQVVPSYFFILYFLATLTVVAITMKQWSNITIYLHFFLSFSVVLIIYRIGYGFDQFIHEATLNFIDKTGAIEPKPFYYLGQYSLIIILHKITTIPIEILNKFLVPVLSAILLPSFLYSFLNKWLEDKKINGLVILGALILPFSFFIATTPQNLAYLFLIITILTGLSCDNFAKLLVTFLFSLTTLLIHPIAGIPAIFFTIVLIIYSLDNNRIKKYFYLLVFAISSLSLPVSFYFLNSNKNASQNNLGGKIESSGSFFDFKIPYLDDFILNFAYLYIFNIKFVFLVLATIGFFLAKKNIENCKIFFVSYFIGFSLLVSYFLTKFISFDFLISYERGDYSSRILNVAIIFFIPFILLALYAFFEKILKQTLGVKIIMLLFVSVLITTSLYASYPRIDAHFNSRGYSTGKFDIEVVNWIEKNAEKDYIVLSNQQVGAAALHEFGFNKYYKNDIYFYPIPTSGPLYEYYLKMVYESPNKKNMADAMNLAGVREGYFVLNKYWWAFPKILEEAKIDADSYKKFGDGEVWVFKFSIHKKELHN